MGLEIQVNSLEEMCDLMCDNKIPTRAPKGQIKVSDKVCAKCIYHTLFGVSERLVGCMYAEREHHCRSLEPDYVHGYCKYFKRGKRKVGDPFRKTYTKAEVGRWTMQER